MPEHESWCCRSPLSPCSLEGGCSDSCNCGADESIEDAVAGPSLGELRAASASLMARNLAASIVPQAMRAEVDRQSYLARASTIGVDQGTAERVLHEVIDDRSRRGLSFEPVFKLAWEKIVSDDA